VGLFLLNSWPRYDLIKTIVKVVASNPHTNAHTRRWSWRHWFSRLRDGDVSWLCRLGRACRTMTEPGRWYRTCRQEWWPWTARTSADQAPTTRTASLASPAHIVQYRWLSNSSFHVSPGYKHTYPLRDREYLDREYLGFWKKNFFRFVVFRYFRFLRFF